MPRRLLLPLALAIALVASAETCDQTTQTAVMVPACQPGVPYTLFYRYPGGAERVLESLDLTQTTCRTVTVEEGDSLFWRCGSGPATQFVESDDVSQTLACETRWLP